jgi:hypothetical protein
MDVAGFLASVEGSSLAAAIRNSLYWFPLIESAHVLGLTLVFGTIAIIDLRLLGLAWTRRPFSTIAADTLTWTWVAFALAAVTGALMFITNAAVYFDNFYFRAKMLLIVVAGVNMAFFEVFAHRHVHRWDRDPSAPPAAKAVAALSLVLWITIIFAGRWIGFTTTKLTVPEDPGINIEDLLPQ